MRRGWSGSRPAILRESRTGKEVGFGTVSLASGVAIFPPGAYAVVPAEAGDEQEFDLLFKFVAAALEEGRGTRRSFFGPS